MTPTVQILIGDALVKLKELPGESVQCVVTSPPYFGLRSYLKNDHPNKGLELGHETTPEEYISKMTAVFSEVKQVLKLDGVIWVNLGDSYAREGGARGGGNRKLVHMEGKQKRMCKIPRGLGIKPKDLVGIPWMLAFALRADGWYLRSDIIWEKPNPMPESVTDRPTKSHEYVFLLSKSERYFYNPTAIRNPPSEALLKQIREGYNGEALKGFEANGVQNASDTKSRIIDGKRKLLEAKWKTPDGWDTSTGEGGHGSFHKNSREKGKVDKQRDSRRHDGFNDRWDQITKEDQMMLGSNARSVWSISPAPYREAHFATYPPELVKRCILAGSRPGDTILDPFAGSFTTGMVSLELGRNFIGCELSEEYVKLGRLRMNVTPGLF